MNKKPNVLLITSDQQHFNTIGHFNPEIKTPNLDRLCIEGTYFNRTYTANPTCTPTRASIITGKMPSQHGAWTLGTKLDEKVHTIVEDFNNAGYKSSLIGKAHFQPTVSTKEYPSLEACPILQDLDFWRHFNDKFYDFDHVELARNHTNEHLVGQHYALWMEEKGLKNWRDYFLPPTGNMDRKTELVWDIPEEYHYDTWIAERTNAMLTQYKENDENFFMWASFFDPHPDYFAPEPWASMYDPDSLTIPSLAEKEHSSDSPFYKISQMEKGVDTSEFKKSGFYLHGIHSHLHDDEKLKKQVAVYYGMISLMDKYIGKILDKLDELGLAENTIVVFTTDHGHYFGQHGLIAKGPFMYEDGIKVPFMVRQPNVIEKNNVSSAMQSLIDLPVTLLDMCGIKAPDGVSGISQKEVWLSQKDKIRDSIICEHNHERDTVNLRTYVDKRYKMTIYYHMNCGEIFDLKNDPHELHNLWNDENYKELKANLMFKFLQAEMEKEPRFMPRVAGA